MKRSTKWLGTGIAGVIATLLILLIVLPRFIPIETVKHDVVTLVKEKTGYELALNGPVRWSVFPWLGVSLSNVVVQVADKTPVMTLKHAEVSVKLLPLLSRRIEIRSIEVDGLAVSLLQEAAGQDNWTTGYQPPTKPKQKTLDVQTPKDNNKETRKEPLIASLNIGGIKVKNLSLLYRNAVASETYQIEQGALTTSAIEATQPFDVKAQLIFINNPYHLQVSLSTRMNFDTSAENLTLNQLLLTVAAPMSGAQSLTLKGDLDYQLHSSMLCGDLSLDSMHLGKWLNEVGIAKLTTSNPKALSNFSMAYHLKLSPDLLSLEKLKLNLDVFSATGEVNAVRAKQSQLEFNLTGTTLNVDDYLPPAPAKAIATKTSEATSAAVTQKETPTKPIAPLIPSDLLNKLNINGKLALEEMVVKGLVFSQPSLQLDFREGLEMIETQADFYDGRITMVLDLDTRQPQIPQLRSKASVDGVSLGQLGRVVTPLASLRGTLVAQYHLTSQGQYQSQLTENLNGRVSFNVVQGEFTKMNLNQAVCNAIAFARKTDQPANDWSPNTTFEKLEGHFLVKNGVALTDDIVASLGAIALQGSGEVNLSDESMDMKASLRILGEQSLGCPVNKNLAKLSWPFVCRGELASPDCGIDEKQVLKNIGILTRDRLEQRLEDKLQLPVKGFLNDLINR